MITDKPLGDIVKSVIGAWDKQSQGLTKDKIEKIWEDVAGKKFVTHSKPVSFKKAKLIINVDSSGWLYELTLRRQEIIKKLKQRIKEKKLEEIQFRIGEL